MRLVNERMRAAAAKGLRKLASNIPKPDRNKMINSVDIQIKGKKNTKPCTNTPCTSDDTQVPPSSNHTNALCFGTQHSDYSQENLYGSHSSHRSHHVSSHLTLSLLKNLRCQGSNHTGPATHFEVPAPLLHLVLTQPYT